MKVLTRDFGEVEVNEEDVISFEEKIFGFEDYTDYIIIYDDEFNGEIAWLQSIEEPSLCFIISNPSLTVVGYEPHFGKDVEKTIGKGIYEYWVIMVVKNNLKESTVNLKSPIVINLENRKAMQTILEEKQPIRYMLFDAGKEQEEC